MIQHHLRHLDIDDLIILSSIVAPDFCCSDVAKTLGLTPPAVTHRLNKYRLHIPNFSIKTQAKRGHYILSPETKAFCIKAREALNALLVTHEAA
jgi:hypothetical protein